MAGWERFTDSFFNARVMAQYLPKIIEGFGLTIVLALCIIAAGLIAGLALAILRALQVRPLNWLIIFLVDLFRALPPLVIIVLLFFGLPSMGMELSGFASAWLALTLVLMAFSEEIFWAGITSVPKGQCGAAAGFAPHHSTADQPHYCDYQGHRARFRCGGAGYSGRGEFRAFPFLQPIATHPGGAGLSCAVLSRGPARPLD